MFKIISSPFIWFLSAVRFSGQTVQTFSLELSPITSICDTDNMTVTVSQTAPPPTPETPKPDKSCVCQHHTVPTCSTRKIHKCKTGLCSFYCMVTL